MVQFHQCQRKLTVSKCKDSAVKQYQEIAILPRPSSQRRKIVHSYTLSATLGGDCDFLGRDLSDVSPYPSVFSGHDNDDLLFLGDEPANDDFLAKLVVGPALQVFHYFWKPLKVSAVSRYLVVELSD